jgi:cob(I)alamin adenosyltransferase
VTNLTALAERRRQAQDELARLQKFPPHIMKMTDTERDAAVTSIQQELFTLDQEISQEAQATNARLIHQVYGTQAQEVTEDARAELVKAQEALEKTVASFSSQTAGYARRVREAQLKVFEAAGNAGQPVRRPDMVLSGLARKLGELVEGSVKHGA